MTVYDKNEATDLNFDEKKALKAAITKELNERAAKRMRYTRKSRS